MRERRARGEKNEREGERERERESFHQVGKRKKNSNVEIPRQVVKKCCRNLGVSIAFSHTETRER
jgi:hypothetical protein